MDLGFIIPSIRTSCLSTSLTGAESVALCTGIPSTTSVTSTENGQRQNRTFSAARSTFFKPAFEQQVPSIACPVNRPLEIRSEGTFPSLENLIETGFREGKRLTVGNPLNQNDAFHVPHIREYIPDLPSFHTPLDPDFTDTDLENPRPPFPFRGAFCTESTVVDLDIVEQPERPQVVRKMMRAGPRKEVFFRGGNVKAAIVTCGGLCPGMNVVIRELVLCLGQIYGVKSIWGIQSGFAGFYDPRYPHIELTPKSVMHIHRRGGTILRTSRGGFDTKKIVDSLEKDGFNMVFVIGGDGAHKGSEAMYEEIRRRKLPISISCIPKAIDNDIPFIDRSFGFRTAVEEACKAIDSAYTESRCYPNGIGVVKIMGRYSGFIALHATLASRLVNVCLVPEVPFTVECLNKYIQHTIKRNGHAVIVLAEGAGQELLPPTGEVDESGNRRLASVGPWLIDEIKTYFAARKTEINLKYIDPTYMIRSVPANAADSVYCSILSYNAVHCAFAGYTGYTSAWVNGKGVMLPMACIANHIARVDPNGRMWYRLLFTTFQPDLSDPSTDYEAIDLDHPIVPYDSLSW